MTKRLKILVCDDERGRADDWAKQIRLAAGDAGTDIDVLYDEFAVAMEGLRGRRLAARDGDVVEPSGDNPIDRASVLVVDYDLLRFDQKGIETGESVAYLARCYSSCGLIVTLNEFGVNAFDLALDPHLESYADLTIGSSQLTNPGLWTAEPPTGFRPWHWPLLGDAARRLEARAGELAGATMREPIVGYFGFPEAAVAALSSSAAEFIGAPANAMDVTFEQFAMESGFGLRQLDRSLGDRTLARISAARIAKWLDLCVLPGQDVLVDAPHLARRFPSVLTGDPSRLEDLGQTARLGRPPTQLGLRHRRLGSARLQRSNWLSRPAWFWPLLMQDESIDEVRSPWKGTELGHEFCEDLSRFAPEDACRPFIAALDSPFARRFVVDHDSKWAQSQLRHIKEGSATDFRAVEYRPPLRFAI